MKLNKWKPILILAAAMIIHSATLLAGSSDQPLILRHTTVKRINGGINPEFFGYRITGDVTRGGNECEATHRHIEFEEKIESRTLFLYAKSTRNSDNEPQCAEVFEPVFDTITTDVRYSSKEIDKIVIINTGTDGSTQTVYP